MNQSPRTSPSPDNAACRYFVSAGASVVVVHVLGAASHLNCRPFGRFLEIQQTGRAFRRRLCLNLSGCTSLDSTVAGLIAKCAYDAEDGHRWGKVCLVRATPRMREVLVNLGLSPVLEFSEDMPEGAGPGMESISRYVKGEPACAPEEIFRAHEALVALDEANVERFADVFEALRDDPGGKPSGGGNPVSAPPPPLREERKRIRFDTRAPFGGGSAA